MKITTLVSAALTLFAVSAGSVSAAEEFATLKGVDAAPMAASELENVKGMHVHFRDAGNGKIHLAGRLDEKNWSSEWGGSDGLPVAPSYKGLCVAAGLSGPGNGISIPGGQVQCPLGAAF